MRKVISTEFSMVRALVTVGTHDGLSGGLDEGRPFERGPQEDRVRCTPDIGPSADAKILGGANHVRETHEEGSPLQASRQSSTRSTLIPLQATKGAMNKTHQDRKDRGAEKGPDETLDRLFRAELEQRGLAKGLAYVSAMGCMVSVQHIRHR